MKRFWTTLLMLALSVAPCAVTHAAKGKAPLAGLAAAHDHASAKQPQAGHQQDHSAGHNMTGKMAGHNDGHDHGDHDCVLHCQAWSSNLSSAGLAIVVASKAPAAPVFVLPQVRVAALQVPAEIAGDGRIPVIDGRPRRQISILNETARRRI